MLPFFAIILNLVTCSFAQGAVDAGVSNRYRSLLQSSVPTLSIPLVTSTVADVSPNPAYYSAFPYCKCNSTDYYNPTALLYNGIGTFGNVQFMLFYITLKSVPIPPAPTTCSGSNVGKVEWNVAPNQDGCIRFAATGVGLTSNHSTSYFLLSNGRGVLRVTDMYYSQEQIIAANNMIPLFLQLSSTCNVSALFDLGYFEFSVFNSQHTCCNPGFLFNTPQPPPPPAFSFPPFTPSAQSPPPPPSPPP
ncbi:hypothetical protein CEUSTIGMA_g5065.t1, partial [Chlamydomonas eustigma]